MYSPLCFVAFALKVTAGTGKGAEYRFEDGQEAKLGRTADNDVVVKDAAASRSHARVFQKGTKYFVEDLGSANGTKINKSFIEGIRELRRGDSVVIGDVVLAFSAGGHGYKQSPESTMDEESLEASEPEPEEDDQPVDDDAEAPRDDDEVSGTREREPPEYEAPPDDQDPDDEAPAEEEDDAPAPDDDEPPEDSNNTTRAFDVPPPKSLVRAPAQRAVRAPARSKSTALAQNAEAGMSAAERARLRRQLQQSSGGRLQLLWEEMPKAARGALIAFMVLMVAGSIGLVVWATGGKRIQRKDEPKELQANGQAIPESFGAGDDVDYTTSDQKTFTFTTASPTRVVGVLHYQARNVARDEVAITLNGADVGTIPPDTMDADNRELDLVLPAVQLRKSEEGNTLVFDNVNNPPRNDTWKVWNVWVEINPVPEMSAEDAERRAQEEIDRANVLAERRDIGAENLFSAWKTYREAWLLLEATPSHSVELDSIARTRMRELRPELDRKCNAMIIEVKKAMNQKSEDVSKARAILEDVPRYFPSREHPCLSYSQALLRDLESMDELPINE